jgi:DNA-binding transcriptional ArsR family regulator
MRAFMAITKALSDQNRVSIVLALEGRELCVCQIIQFLGLAPSTVSKHLAILKQARLIEDRKDGRWMYYRLADEDAPIEVREAIGWVCRSFADSTSPKIKKAAQRLQAILALDPKELCSQQNRNIAVV